MLLAELREKMLRYIFGVFTVTIIITVSSCTKGVSVVHELPLPSLNPTSYSFNVPLHELRERTITALSVDHQIKDPVFGPSITGHAPCVLNISDAKSPVFGTELLTKSENVNDLYLQSFSEPLWKSPVYRGSDEGLPFIADFHIHFKKAGTNATFVSISALETRIVNGMSYGFGPCGPGWGWRFIPVKPTSIEEYQLIRYIGKAVGATGMPEIVLPLQIK